MHRLRAWIDKNKGVASKGVITVDLNNAFNAIDRSAFQTAVRRWVPQLAPFVDLAYGQTSWVFLGQHRLASERGIQQGDPAGPGLFGMGIQTIVEEATRETLDAYPMELDLSHFPRRWGGGGVLEGVGGMGQSVGAGFRGHRPRLEARQAHGNPNG